MLALRRGGDEILVAALLGESFAREAADPGRLALLRQESGELELVEVVDGPDIGMGEVDDARVEVAGDEPPLQLALATLARGFGTWPALLWAQQVNQGAALSGAW